MTKLRKTYTLSQECVDELEKRKRKTGKPCSVIIEECILSEPIRQSKTPDKNDIDWMRKHIDELTNALTALSTGSAARDVSEGQQLLTTGTAAEREEVIPVQKPNFFEKMKIRFTG